MRFSDVCDNTGLDRSVCGCADCSEDGADSCYLPDEFRETLYHDHMERDHDEPYDGGDDDNINPDVWDGQPDEMQEWHDFDPDC